MMTSDLMPNVVASSKHVRCSRLLGAIDPTVTPVEQAMAGPGLLHDWIKPLVIQAEVPAGPGRWVGGDQLQPTVAAKDIARLIEDRHLIEDELERRLKAARTADPTQRREEALRVLGPIQRKTVAHKPFPKIPAGDRTGRDRAAIRVEAERDTVDGTPGNVDIEVIGRLRATAVL